MIIKENRNTPVAAPQMADMSAALLLYHTFSGDAETSMNDFIKFLALPSQNRDEFLNLFTLSVIVENDSYVKLIYSDGNE